jgi:uncharacterized membrane protein
MQEGARDMNFEYNMVLVGVLLFAVGVPLILKLVPPNPFVGVRTSKIWSSREVWYAANRLAGINAAIAGVVIVAAALLVPRLIPDYSEGVKVLIIGTIVLFAIVVMVSGILLQMRRM